MSQIMKETICGNQKFRACVVDGHKCVNCNKVFFDLIKKGDFIEDKCWSCRKFGKIKVQYVWSHQIEGRCKECRAMDNAIGQLFQDFVWASETDDGDYKDIEEKALDKIVKLPKEQLKEFLRRMNSGIER